MMIVTAMIFVGGLGWFEASFKSETCFKGRMSMWKIVDHVETVTNFKCEKLK